MAQDGFQQQVDPAAVQQNPNLKDVKVDQKPGAQVPLTAAFKDESGKSVTFGSLLKGRPIVFLPIFYRCTGVCNIELQSVLNALIQDPSLLPGRDLDVVALSIDPEGGPRPRQGQEGVHARRIQEAEDRRRLALPHGRHGQHPLGHRLDGVRLRLQRREGPGEPPVSGGVMVLTPKGQVSTYMLRGASRPRGPQAGRGPREQVQIRGEVGRQLLRLRSHRSDHGEAQLGHSKE